MIPSITILTSSTMAETTNERSQRKVSILSRRRIQTRYRKSSILPPLALLVLSFLLGVLSSLQCKQSSPLFASAQLILSNSTDNCHLPLTTLPVLTTTSSNGIIFSIQSSTGDAIGPTVTSLGFHIDPSQLDPALGMAYEVYALNRDGYYADPNRGELADNTALEYDYRGVLGEWSLIASGSILSDDLELGTTTLNIMENDYYQIPFEIFIPTMVPPNGNQKSFYITLTPTISAFQYAELEDGQVLNSPVAVLANGVIEDPLAPTLLVGEGVVQYPFPTSPFLYAPKVFVGRVFYEWQCPTEAPSLSLVPSGMPTPVDSEVPSGMPTVSFVPSAMPSFVTEVPSLMPSAAPVVPSVSSGLLLSLTVPSCAFDDNGDPVEMTDDEKEALATTVVETSREQFADAGVTNPFAEVAKVDFNCLTEVEVDGQGRRILPTASSAIGVSLVVTGEYRPIVRPDGSIMDSDPPDLGAVAEDSINRDPQAFVRDLAARQPEGGSLSKVEDIVATDGPDGVSADSLAEITITRTPTVSPTDRPTLLAEVKVDVSEGSLDQLLLIGIIIACGLLVLLGSVLLYRYAERKAVQNRRKTMDRLEEAKYKAQMQGGEKTEWDGGDGVGGVVERYPSHQSGVVDDGSWANKEKMMYGGGGGYPAQVYGGGPPPPPAAAVNYGGYPGQAQPPMYQVPPPQYVQQQPQQQPQVGGYPPQQQQQQQQQHAQLQPNFAPQPVYTPQHQHISSSMPPMLTGAGYPLNPYVGLMGSPPPPGGAPQGTDGGNPSLIQHQPQQQQLHSSLPANIDGQVVQDDFRRSNISSLSGGGNNSLM